MQFLLLGLAALLLFATVIAGGIRDRVTSVPPVRAPAAL